MVKPNMRIKFPDSSILDNTSKHARTLRWMPLKSLPLGGRRPEFFTVFSSRDSMGFGLGFSAVFDFITEFLTDCNEFRLFTKEGFNDSGVKVRP